MVLLFLTDKEVRLIEPGNPHGVQDNCEHRPPPTPHPCCDYFLIGLADKSRDFVDLGVAGHWKPAEVMGSSARTVGILLSLKNFSVFSSGHCLIHPALEMNCEASLSTF